MTAFRTLYPYLKLIAHANGICDPFDERVVEAYWLGNDLLERVGKSALYHSLLDDHGAKQHLGNASFHRVRTAIENGAIPHHSFHVFGIWKRTGNHSASHTLESMDSCRVSSGIVKTIDGPFLAVETEPLIEQNHTLALGEPRTKRLLRHLGAPPDIDEIRVGAIVSIHWDVPCEVITQNQAAMLRAYTLRSIALANQFHLFEQ
jgi:hypothetical protein